MERKQQEVEVGHEKGREIEKKNARQKMCLREESKVMRCDSHGNQKSHEWRWKKEITASRRRIHKGPPRALTEGRKRLKNPQPFFPFPKILSTVLSAIAIDKFLSLQANKEKDSFGNVKGNPRRTLHGLTLIPRVTHYTTRYMTRDLQPNNNQNSSDYYDYTIHYK
ncbi:hypothetical protein RUM44_010189 [Polyplax serrata]|uniref:Uncharacterized protein n=1 Tax=Polyplax serrata TaxID=468196 RepID=A0ABR1AUW0_POLSC